MRVEQKPKLQMRHRLVWVGAGVFTIGIILFTIFYTGLSKITKATVLQENCWTGEKNQNFFNDKNWSLGHAPDFNEKAVIDIISEKPIEIGKKDNIEIGELEIKSGVKLVVKGNLQISNHASLHSFGSAIQLEGNLNIGFGLFLLNQSELNVLKGAELKVNKDITVENASIYVNGGLVTSSELELRRKNGHLVINSGKVQVFNTLGIFNSSEAINKVEVYDGILEVLGYISYQKQNESQINNGQLVTHGGTVIIGGLDRNSNDFYIPSSYTIIQNGGAIEFTHDLVFDTLNANDLLAFYGDNTVLWNENDAYLRKNENDVVRVKYNNKEYWLSNKVWNSKAAMPGVSDHWIEKGKIGEKDATCNCVNTVNWNSNYKYVRDNKNHEIFVMYNDVIYRMNATATITKGNVPSENKWAWVKWYECNSDVKFYNDKFKSNGGELILNGALTIREPLIMPNTKLSIGSGNNLVINKPVNVGDFYISNKASIKLNATISVNGNIEIQAQDPFTGKGRVKLIGQNKQTFYGGNEITLSKLVLNKDSGDVFFKQNLRIKDSLIWQSSTPLHAMAFNSFKPGAGNNAVLKFDSNATFAGKGWVNGPVRKLARDEFIFPVGNSERSAYIELSKPQDSSLYQVEYSTGYPPNYNALNSGLKYISQLEFWSINAIYGDANVVPTVYWENADWSCIGSAEDLIVAGLINNEWSSLGLRFYKEDDKKGSITAQKTIANSQLITFGSKSVLNPLNNGESPFVVSQNDNLVLIDANHADELVKQVVLISNGNSNKPQRQILNNNYSNAKQWMLPDNTEINENSLIEIETKSGKIFYNTVNLNKMQEAELNVFPNPFVNQVTVSLNAIIESNATLQLIDNNTKVLIQKQVTPDQLSSGYVISQLNDYKPGVYFVRVVANSVTKSFRIVKQ